MKPGHVTFTIKPLQQYFVMILLILPSKLVLTFESVEENVGYNHTFLITVA